jgi:very-short-patch-repair endonuclease
LNPFEADVKDALEGRGMTLLPQYGTSHYRIDLVAVHPQKVSRPVLAIECDGASYHSGATARERDRLRQQQLMRRGWLFHRIWSTDWFYHREEEVERAFSAYEEALNHADVVDAEADTSRPPPVSPKPTASSEPPLQPKRGPSPVVPRRSTIDEFSRSELLRVAEWAMSDGLLRTDHELMRDMLEALGFERLGSKMRVRLEEAIRDARSRQQSNQQALKGPLRLL